MNLPREPLAGEALAVVVIEAGASSESGLSRLVTRLGHGAAHAGNADEALQQLERREPDVILMALGELEEGIAAAARIRRRLGTSTRVIHVPSIQVVGENACLLPGEDDVLPARIVRDRLPGKLRDLARIRALERETAGRRAQIEHYLDAVEEEQRTASGLMHRLVQMDAISDAAVRYRFTPAQQLSGDVIAVARTPGNCLHVLLADGTGHGLAASLGVMPVVQPFYAMTQKGFGLATIAKEINRKVREWLPVGRFVAASLIEIDPHARMVSVWNGGNPPLVLIGEDGAELHRFVSRQLPLGIVCSREMELGVDRLTIDGRAQLIVCSDGVIEAMNPSGCAFGIDRMIAVAAASPPESRLRSISGALDEHLAGHKPHDDLSLVVVDCAATDEKEGTADPAAAASMRALRNWRFEVEFSPEDLRQIDVVPLLLATLERMNLPAVHRSNLFVVLSELFNNALDHGVLLLDSRLKVGGMERYLALRGKRLAMLTEGWIRVELRMIERGAAPCLRIHVRDSGEGFDWRGPRDASQSTALHGRGLGLVRRLCTSVDFRGAGNEVVAIYTFAPL